MKNLANNQLQLSGKISGKVEIRFSPSNIGHAEFLFEHSSTQYEGHLSRQVFCKIRTVISGEMFKIHQPILQSDTALLLTGFLSVRQQRNGAQEMVFYVQHLELIKESQHDQEASTVSAMAQEVL